LKGEKIMNHKKESLIWNLININNLGRKIEKKKEKKENDTETT
jgi:hypothetical protein